MENYFMFGPSFFQSVFSDLKFPKLSIVESVQDLQPQDIQGKDVLLEVSPTKPTGIAHIRIGSDKDGLFQARVVLSVSIEPDDFNDENDKWNFSASRICRHGNGLNGWWKQDRNPESKLVMTQVKSFDGKKDLFPELPSEDFYYVVLYARVKEFVVEEYKLDMHRSLGGQCSIFCNCREDEKPLIESGGDERKKRNCMSLNCTKREGYMCPQKGCKTRICSRCFNDKVRMSDGSRVLLWPGMENISQNGSSLVDEVANGTSESNTPNDDQGASGHQSNEGDSTRLRRPDDTYVPDGFEEEDHDELMDTEDYEYGNNDQDDDEVCDEECYNGESDEYGDEVESVGEYSDEDSIEGHPSEEVKVWDCCEPEDADIMEELFPGFDENESDGNLTRGPEDPASGCNQGVNFVDVPCGYFSDQDESCRSEDEYDDDNRDSNLQHNESGRLGTGIPYEEDGERKNDLGGVPRKKQAEDFARLSAAGRIDGKNYSLLDRHVSSDYSVRPIMVIFLSQNCFFCVVNNS